MGKMALKPIAMGACLTLAIGSFVACSSSSSPGSTSTDGDGGGGTGNTSNICPKIPVADIQALVTGAPGAITENDSPPSNEYECDTAVMQIQLDTADADMSTYNIAKNTGDVDGAAPQNIHQMTGIGDEAYWFSVDDGSGTAVIAVPIVNVHKGSATCTLNPTSDDNTQFTIPATPGAIKDTDADAWATKAGKVCLDIISAGGG